MDVKMTIEWDYQCGISPNKVLELLDNIEEWFIEKNYGTSISIISVIMTAVGYDLKQRKRFKKDIGRFEYDILLDYFLIKNVEMEEKKKIIRRQIIEITEQTFNKYRFEDFDKAAFLSDLKEIVKAVEW
jgi:hypothetical protein